MPHESGQKPFVVFDGNCQAHHLAAIIEAGGIAETWVNGRDFGTIPSFRGRLARYADENACAQMVAHARSQGRVCVQATQSTPWSDQTPTAYTGLVHQVVRFPYLHCNAYLRASGEGCAAGLLKRVYEADLDVIRLCQGYACSGFDFAGFIEAEQVRHPLFHMHVHPGPALTSELVRDLGRRTEAFPDDAIEAMARECAAGEGINVFTQHPIAASAREVLGFGWPHDYAVYADMIATARRGDWPRFLAQASVWEARFANETQYWSGLFDAAVGLRQDALAAASFERLIALSPGFPQFWTTAYAYFEGGKPALRERVLSVYMAQRQSNNILSSMDSMEGHHDQAIAHAHRFLEQAQDLNDGFVPLMLALVAAGRADEARAGTYAFAMAQGAERRRDIEAVIRAYPPVRDLVLPEV